MKFSANAQAATAGSECCGSLTAYRRFIGFSPARVVVGEERERRPVPVGEGGALVASERLAAPPMIGRFGAGFGDRTERRVLPLGERDSRRHDRNSLIVGALPWCWSLR